MPQVVTMATLEERVRSFANMESGGPVSSIEIRRHLLSGLARVRDELLAAGQEVERSTWHFVTAPGQSQYALPSDFYRLLAVIVADGSPVYVGQGYGYAGPSAGMVPLYDPPAGAPWLNLDPFEMQEIARLRGGQGSCPGALRYRQRGVSGTRVLELLPVPTGQWYVEVHYITAIDLDDTADYASFDGLNGFEQIAVLEAAAYCLAKEETDNGLLLRMAESEWQRLRDVAPALDRSRPARVVDVTGATDDVWGGGGFGRGWWG